MSSIKDSSTIISTSIREHKKVKQCFLFYRLYMYSLRLRNSKKSGTTKVGTQVFRYSHSLTLVSRGLGLRT